MNTFDLLQQTIDEIIEKISDLEDKLRKKILAETGAEASKYVSK